MFKIAVAGAGYVGLSNAILLSQHHEVIAYDVCSHKVQSINDKKSPIVDAEIELFLRTKPLNLKATTDKAEAYLDADFIIIALLLTTMNKRITLIRCQLKWSLQMLHRSILML